MQVKDITKVLEKFAPPALQESYDNAGLLVGEKEKEIDAVLLCLDVTEDVVEEAILKKCGLIVSHHPLIFRGLKKITGSNPVERIVMRALRENIALFASHTNIDNTWGGVNSRIAGKIGLSKQQVILPADGILRKLVVFVPSVHAPKVREAIFNAGAGHIGEYDHCSFNLEGEGSFRGSDESKPFAGSAGAIHYEKEVRVETIFPAFLENSIIKSMIKAHPYEEVAYDIYALQNHWDRAGMGIVGELNNHNDPYSFLSFLKSLFGTKSIRHTKPPEKDIERVAVCGGSGSSLIREAKRHNADVFVSGDFKYHDFFDGGPDMMIADIGHFESEQFTVEIFYEILTKNFPNFAVHFSDVNTNPIHYF